MIDIKDIPSHLPVLIAGPTASGKSALALEIAQKQGGHVINADALQVFDGWRILTARPTPTEEAQAPHHLYGHVSFDQPYSVGQWLRDVTPLLNNTGTRPIIVGGTGLYFTALTEGLAEIPPIPATIRQQADARRKSEGHAALLSELDPDTQNRVDPLNPMRVQRAWEVQAATGRGLADWQADTPAPLLPLSAIYPIVLQADRDWLNARISRRFHQMIDQGVIDEARTMLPGWDPKHLSSRAIGAPELIDYLQGQTSLETAIEKSIVASRRYAKRQRSWFRARMGDWNAYVAKDF